jgi:putative ABC transport system permease protein
MGRRKTVKYKSNSVQNAIIGGVSYDYYKIKSFEITNGRYFTKGEADAGYRMAVIGYEIAKGLFPNEDPVGKEIKISGFKATVIGVTKKEGESILGPSFDYQVIIPFNFARNVMDPKSERADPIIYCKAKDGVTTQQLKDELTGIMRGVRRLKPGVTDNFALNETSLLTKGFDSFFEVLGTAGWIIGGFSILVGGFGIANIMFVSVRERTNLIGIQKSLGAKNLFILFQFLSESVILSLVGGSFGLLLTWLIMVLGRDSIDMEISLTGTNVVLAFTISILIGVISGFIPAYSASQLDPVEAIRSN